MVYVHHYVTIKVILAPSEYLGNFFFKKVQDFYVTNREMNIDVEKLGYGRLHV